MRGVRRGGERRTAVVVVAREVAVGRDAEVLRAEQPVGHHRRRLGVGGRLGEHRVEGRGRDAPVEGAVPEPVGEDAPLLVPQVARDERALRRRALRQPRHDVVAPADERREFRERLRLHRDHRREAHVVQPHLPDGVRTWMVKRSENGNLGGAWLKDHGLRWDLR